VVNDFYSTGTQSLANLMLRARSLRHNQEVGLLPANIQSKSQNPRFITFPIEIAISLIF
jgi:hypothetical protein